MFLKNISIYILFFLYIIQFIFLFVFTLIKNNINIINFKFINIILLLLYLFFCIYFFNNVIYYNQSINIELNIHNNNWLNINYCLNFQIDSISLLFIILIIIIGIFTNIYILVYFKDEKNEINFVLLINWFIFSMLLLVISNNLYTIIIGWELIGLTSFLLINFWKNKKNILNSSFKAFFFNKISDIFLILSFIIFWFNFNTFNLNIINNILYFSHINYNLKIGIICLIISCSIKSAQIIGHIWLPDSMEAPVPASALIHSATLVSAGIFLILKFYKIINYYNLNNIIFILGSFTCCFGGICSAAQTDLKKLLAYSTISHCGFLFILCSFGNFIYIFIYLYLHGIFKALTFFCVGSIIKHSNNQDIRYLGGIYKKMPVDVFFLTFCSINLGGLPLTIGFLYKSIFLNCIINYNYNFFFLGLQYIGLLSSLIYTIKLILFIFFDFFKNYNNDIIYNLQFNQLNNNNYWTTTTNIYIISIFFPIIFTFFLYIYYYYILLKYNISILFNFNYNNNYNNNYLINLYNNYFIIFYNIYIYIYIVFFIINWNNNIWKNQQNIYWIIIIYIYLLNKYFFYFEYLINYSFILLKKIIYIIKISIYIFIYFIIKLINNIKKKIIMIKLIYIYIYLKQFMFIYINVIIKLSFNVYIFKEIISTLFLNFLLLYIEYILKPYIIIYKPYILNYINYKNLF